MTHCLYLNLLGTKPAEDEPEAEVGSEDEEEDVETVVEGKYAIKNYGMNLLIYCRSYLPFPVTGEILL